MNNKNRLSEIIGPPLSDSGAMTMADFLVSAAQQHGEKEALCWRDGETTQRYSYVELLEQSKQVARALLASGAGKESRVGLLCSNRPEWLFSMFGIAMSGATTVTLNTFATRQELAQQLQLADVQTLIVENSIASHDFIDELKTLCPLLASCESGGLLQPEFPYLRSVISLDNVADVSGIQAWPDFVASGQSIPESLLEAVQNACSPVDHGFVFFSSGTTGKPKAIVQTQRAAALQCRRFGEFFEIDASVRTWSANGFFWSGNFAMALGGTLGVGGCLVLQAYFDADEALELLQGEKVSQAIAWPHQEARFRECPGWEKADLSSLRWIDVDSAMATHPSVNSKWHQPQGFGATETFTFVTGRKASDYDDTHGEVLAGNTLRIVDPLSGELMPLGEPGEICVKGPTLTPGLLKVPLEDSVDGDGFLHSGDEGYFTDAGRLVWKGRLSDIIKTGGANVSPAEIEEALGSHAQVQSGFIVGVPHETLGEMVVACVLLRSGEASDEKELRAHVRETLASYKVPRRVLFYAEEELPVTGSNKVRRKDLAEDAAKRLAAEDPSLEQS